MAIEPQTITTLERITLEDIANSDHSSDGHGHGAWIEDYNFRTPMRQLRGVITSLQNKGIVATDDWSDPMRKQIWVAITGDYQEGYKSEYNNGWGDDSCPFTHGMFGFKIVNVIGGEEE